MSFKVICCLGDSIANGYWDERGLGWFGRLQEKIATYAPYKFGFNNLAQSGDRSIDVLHRLGAEAMHREPDILIIAVGINDIIRWQSPEGSTDQSQQTSHESWQRILQTAKKVTDKILILGLIPVDEKKHPCTGYDGITPMWNFNSDVETYNLNLSKLCNSQNVAFLNPYPEWLKDNNVKLLHDESHPNSKGHELLCTQIFNKLKELKWLNS